MAELRSYSDQPLSSIPEPNDSMCVRPHLRRKSAIARFERSHFMRLFAMCILSAVYSIRPPSGPKVYDAQARAGTALTTSLRCPRPVGSHAPGSSLGRYCCSSPCNRNNVLDYCSGSLSREALCSWGTETESNHRSALQSDRNCPAAESLISSVTHYVSARVILS